MTVRSDENAKKNLLFEGGYKSHKIKNLKKIILQSLKNFLNNKNSAFYYFHKNLTYQKKESII